MVKRVGIIGCGLIGSHIADGVIEDPDMDLAFVMEPEEARARPYAEYRIHDLQRAAELPCDVVVECANPQVLVDMAEEILTFSDLMVLSITAFADDSFRSRVQKICKRHRRRVYLPHGAVLGLDGILDGREVIESVQVTTTKRPENLGRRDSERTELYSGAARRACELFPRNVNVHAVVAMSGVGFDRTMSTIISDPAAEGNAHVIRVRGERFRFGIEVRSLPGGEVSSSYTPQSALNSLRRAMEESHGFVFV